MRLALSVLLTVAVCTSLGCSRSNPEAEKAAVEAAEAWLALLDSGQYATSWRLASESFQAAVPEARWKDKAMGVRMQFGKLLSRQVKSARYTTELPGAPDGQYVVIEFDASYTNKKIAIETVTPMLEANGVWRVSGYYAK
jgi:hypothetical protein